MSRWPAACLTLAALAGFVVAPGLAYAQSGPGAPDCTSYPCGRIESIRQTTVQQSWTPLGMGVGVAPGQASGQVTTSFQIGPGFSNQGMVILGAGGGATYRKSPNSYEQPRWEVTVKLDNGQTRVVTVAYEPFVREGDRVRVAGTSLELVE